MSEHTIAEEEDQEEVQEKLVVGSNEPSIGHGERAKSVAVEVEQEQTSLMFPGQKVIKGFSDGTHYEGEWKFGRAHGTVSLISPLFRFPASVVSPLPSPLPPL
eukprot:760006-Hanusia_phi.AAC.8